MSHAVGLGYVREPAPPRMHEQYAASYRRLWDRHWWWRARRCFVKRLIRQLSLPDEGAVLDIGCGDALFFDDLAEYGEVYGIESDARLIDEDNPHRDRIHVGAFGPDYPAGRQYKLITMLDVLEHIEDDRGTLGRVHRLLAPGGYLVMTVPAMQWLWSMHDVANEHYRRYNLPELRDKVQEQGFTQENGGYTFGWTVGGMLIRRLVAPAPMQGHDAEDYTVTPPVAPVNHALYGLTRMEQFASRLVGLPLGSSVYMVARKAG